MVDLYAMQSPSGGSGWGERLYSGASGIATFGLSLGLGRWLSGPGMQKRVIRVSTRRAVNNTLATRSELAERVSLRKKNLEDKDLLKRRAERLFTRGGFGTPFGFTDKEAVLARTESQAKVTFERAKTYQRQYLKKASASIRESVTGIKTTFSGARTLFSGLGWALAASWIAGEAFEAFRPAVSETAMKSNEQIFNRGMIDSGMAYTQRQRAVQAIHDSQLTIQGVIGQEAQYMHK